MLEQISKIALWSHERAEPLIDQLGTDLALCKKELPSAGTKVTNFRGRKARLVRYSEGIYTAVAFSFDAYKLRSSNIMDIEVRTVIAAAPLIDTSAKRAEQRTKRLIHNLKSITAKTSQEIFYLVKQDALMGSPKEALDYVAEEVKDNSRDTAKALMEILKHQLAQKAEYSAFEKLSGKIDSTKMEVHDVHRVLMNVFYLFFGEFLDRKIKARVEPTRLQALFDYESIHACIYYLVENAAKYAMRNSYLNVTTSYDGNGFIDIRFEMESLSISNDEEEAIFEEGVSGRRAHSEGLNGAGLGLYLARAMARLNGGTLHLHPGRQLIGGIYSRNSFVLSLRADPSTRVV
jgi:signal transduction histidine kinase